MHTEIHKKNIKAIIKIFLCCKTDPNFVRVMISIKENIVTNAHWYSFVLIEYYGYYMLWEINIILCIFIKNQHKCISAHEKGEEEWDSKFVYKM